jgi:hypothetical protein
MEVFDLDLIILDSDFNQIAVLDYCASVIWTERYCENGDCELYLPATEEAIKLLKADYYVQRSDQPSKVMIIKSLNISTDIEGGDWLTVRGVGASELLARRIVWNQTTLTGSPTQVVRNIITENLISPTEEERQISCIELGEAPELIGEINKQLYGTDLLNATIDILNTYGYGFGMVYKSKIFKFEIYQGQRVPVAFSDEFDNLNTSTYTADVSGVKNACMIAGEKYNNTRIQTSVGNTSGVSRYEMFVDADDVNREGGIISESEYIELLKQQGTEELAKHRLEESFEANVNASGNFKLGIDYNLGDIVLFRNKYGITQEVRITEIIECWDENGYTCEPTFENVNGGNNND